MAYTYNLLNDSLTLYVYFGENGNKYCELYGDINNNEIDLRFKGKDSIKHVYNFIKILKTKN